MHHGAEGRLDIAISSRASQRVAYIIIQQTHAQRLRLCVIRWLNEWASLYSCCTRVLLCFAFGECLFGVCSCPHLADLWHSWHADRLYLQKLTRSQDPCCILDICTGKYVLLPARFGASMLACVGASCFILSQKTMHTTHS